MKATKKLIQVSHDEVNNLIGFFFLRRQNGENI